MPTSWVHLVQEIDDSGALGAITRPSERNDETVLPWRQRCFWVCQDQTRRNDVDGNRKFLSEGQPEAFPCV